MSFWSMVPSTFILSFASFILALIIEYTGGDLCGETVWGRFCFDTHRVAGFASSPCVGNGDRALRCAFGWAGDGVDRLADDDCCEYRMGAAPGDACFE